MLNHCIYNMKIQPLVKV
ncbi:hypothetical protein Bhyg_07813 [Pseudolycoriella hygida]|uniref:Uncharacterized protein n=1 Tax=Pseudolycoriella hygida TaxID=35572 RepID=A0A9Q0N482_9DIPT|nr:hypothetical protein Bhyg_07813 [Pseudolycoriella hygida]